VLFRSGRGDRLAGRTLTAPHPDDPPPTRTRPPTTDPNPPTRHPRGCGYGRPQTFSATITAPSREGGGSWRRPLPAVIDFCYRGAPGVQPWPPQAVQQTAATPPERMQPMTSYAMPTIDAPAPAEPGTVYLVSSGDLRESANQASWPVQEALEQMLTRAIEAQGYRVVRAHGIDPDTGHGFISSQRMGLEVFATIPREVPLVVAIGNWQYSSHVLPGLRSHAGPILTVANFLPGWPGLVGLLGLNGGLTKMGKPYSTLWTVDGTDDWF